MPSASSNSPPLSVRSRPKRRRKASSPTARSTPSRASTVASLVLAGISSGSCTLHGRGSSVSRHWESVGLPTTVSISQARARSSSGSAMKAAKERPGPWWVALAAFPLLRGL